MATLLDHRRQSRTTGSVANLAEFMVTAAIGTPFARRLKTSTARKRYAQSLVKAAIRRDGTVEGLQLVMDDPERARWESANPLSEG